MRHFSAMLVMFAGAFAACYERANVQCEQDSNCDLSGGGVCTSAETGNRWCAYPDPNCPAGYRYSTQAVGDGVSGACVAESMLVSIGQVSTQRHHHRRQAVLRCLRPVVPAATMTAATASRSLGGRTSGSTMSLATPSPEICVTQQRSVPFASTNTKSRWGGFVHSWRQVRGPKLTRQLSGQERTRRYRAAAGKRAGTRACQLIRRRWLVGSTIVEVLRPGPTRRARMRTGQ
jgi:hypothetical protein